MVKMSRKTILKYLGAPPDQIGAELAAFTEAVKMAEIALRLSSSGNGGWLGSYEWHVRHRACSCGLIITMAIGSRSMAQPYIW